MEQEQDQEGEVGGEEKVPLKSRHGLSVRNERETRASSALIVDDAVIARLPVVAGVVCSLVRPEHCALGKPQCQQIILDKVAYLCVLMGYELPWKIASGQGGFFYYLTFLDQTELKHRINRIMD